VLTKLTLEGDGLMTDSRIGVLCVDDHPMVLEGVAHMIDRQSDMRLVAAAPTGELAVALHQQFRPDITLMDLQLPAMSGLEAIRAILAEAPEARIVVLTIFQGDEDIYRALQAGAVTYLLKDARSEELLRVIRDVHAGRRPLPPGVASLLSKRNAETVLTAREVEVIKLIAKGMRNKEIADLLCISEKTAAVHIRNIFAKFQINDRTAAITIAIQRGFLHIE
jgi:DNA-binding NarL/FixJ family response regulator